MLHFGKVMVKCITVRNITLISYISELSIINCEFLHVYSHVDSHPERSRIAKQKHSANVRYRMANGGLTPHPKLVGEDPAPRRSGLLKPPGSRNIQQPEEMTVEWPMLLLYDEVNQSDFVAAFDERFALEVPEKKKRSLKSKRKTHFSNQKRKGLDKFQDQLQMMFPDDRHVVSAQGSYQVYGYLHHAFVMSILHVRATLTFSFNAARTCLDSYN